MLGYNNYIELDSSFRVIEDCRQDGWAKVRTVFPKELSSYRGWVKSASLLTEEEFAKTGYTELDIPFDAQTRLYRSVIVRAVNKIRLEDSRCKDYMDVSTVSIASDRSKPRQPVFFVTCGISDGVVNVFFSEADLVGGKSFVAPGHIDHIRQGCSTL